VELTNDEPIIKGVDVQISPSESNELITKYSYHIDDLRAKENYNGDMRDFILDPAGVVATLETCKDVYGSVPTEEELQAAIMELSKKSNLFYKFMINIVNEGFENI